MASHPSRLTPVSEWLAAARSARPPSEPRTVPAREAVGWVLAQNLVAPGPVPPHAVALRTGYAVAAQDLVGVSSYAPLVLPAPPPRVRAGERLPPGTDAVLPVDAVAASGVAAEVFSEAAPGENVRRPGEDAAAGQVLCRAGTVFSPLDLALASVAGIGEASVRRFTLLLAGERANIDLLQGLAGHFRSGMRAEIQTIDSVSVEDAKATLRSSSADLILLSAADAPGLADVADGPVSGLALLGAETALVGAGPVPLLLAPPRLDALLPLMVCVVAPYAAWVTARAPRPAWRRGRLARKIASPVGLTELVLVREANGSLEPLGAGPITLASLAAAEGVLVVPPDSEGYPEGAEVEADEL